ncbi:MAG TPA: hypothetical protein EYP55_01690 [Anaerolineae bacterium]|nr:hypothetical protein [Anaerolineae bacterium]
MFLSPALILSLVLAGIYAALFHLLWGQSAAQLARYGLIGLLGFGLGQLLAGALGSRLLMIGQVHLLEGTLVCWACLFIAKRLKV